MPKKDDPKADSPKGGEAVKQHKLLAMGKPIPNSTKEKPSTGF